MEIKHGLISADSHALLDHDAYTERMSRAKWGDLIPHLVEVEGRGGKLVHRWSVYGKPPRPGERGFNCPAAPDDVPVRDVYPDRWEEVPPRAHDPVERGKALDADGQDAEVLFPDRTF